MQWDDYVYIFAFGLMLGAMGVFNSASRWRKMERLYGDLQKQAGHTA